MECKLGLYSQKLSPTDCKSEKYFACSRFKFAPNTEGEDFMKILSRFDDSRPARACIEVSKSSKGVDIGIEAIDHISEVS